MPAAATVVGIVHMESDKGCPTRSAWVTTMKPNFIDRCVLGVRKHVLVPLFDKCVWLTDTEDLPWVILPLLGLSLIYLCGCPVMLWIRCRGLLFLLEDDDHRRTYPCRLIHGERGVNWKKEGF